MKHKNTGLLLTTALIFFSAAWSGLTADPLGKFSKKNDLFLAQFDSKTDVDDIHSIAATAIMLADERFDGVSYHAVAGAYGTQKGLYVPANDLFELAFGKHWSDAHSDFDKALDEVRGLAMTTLQSGGNLWIAEAGQSDFSAALIRRLRAQLPDLNLKNRIHIVQHSNWNEKMTTPEDLSFVKEAVTYHKIPDGNKADNGTPKFRSDEPIPGPERLKDTRLVAIWEKAVAIANKYNGADGRHLNKSIHNGGVDFSDVVESAWIFGFNDLTDAEDFFREFTGQNTQTGSF